MCGRSTLAVRRSLEALFLAGFLASSLSHPRLAWATDWNETANGDLSNNRLAPTQIALTVGSNVVTATMPGSDLDYLTVTISAGHVFSGVTLLSYVSTDGTAFIGMQSGTQITVPDNTGSPAALLGYTHFGTGPGNVGQNILPSICTGFGAIGCAPPLPAGSYSFWIRQANTVAVSYQFDFQMTALPPERLAGDYNGDEVVDAGDYTVWRNSLGDEGEDLAADGSGPEGLPDGVVDEHDYAFWKMHYGSVLMGGAAGISIVPEPNAGAMIVVAVLGAGRMRRWRRG